jgi:hypothetical protein
MGNDVQLISDGEGLAVIGGRPAVERILERAGLLAVAAELDLGRLGPLLGVGSDLAQAASSIAANSARWIKLTEESARRVQEHGLMPSKTDGQSHLMVGEPGQVKNWLQTDQQIGSLLTNPAALSGVSGIMAQAALRQAIGEINEYLVKVDRKVDDVLRKVDDAVVAQMVGAGQVIERAMTIREETGEVNETLWSTVDQTHQTIAATQTYALDQLDAVAQRLETTRVQDLAETSAHAETEVPKWLAVLARCFQLQNAIDVVELDRVLAVSPEGLVAYRAGLTKAQQARQERIADHTAHLLDRMNKAVGTANARLFWNRTRCLEIVGSANHLASEIHEVHGVLRIESEPQSWHPRELGRGASIGAQAIQVTKDKGPMVATATAGVVSVIAAGKHKQN